MPPTKDSTGLSHSQKLQGTTGGGQLAPKDLLAFRALFLLLDAWDRNGKSAGPVDTQTESEQGERRARSISTRRQRAA